VQGTCRFAAHDCGFCRARLSQCGVAIYFDKGIYLGIDLVNPVQVRFNQFHR
jgi:hypothetical protein